MNVTGKWKGEYTFEETTGGGEAKVLGKIVPFSMILKQGWLGNVTGTIQDDPREGFAEEGTIRGKIKGNVISFDKLMPVFRHIHEPSRTSLQQFTERHNLVMDADHPHPKIRHIGDIAADGNSIEGTWLMQEFSMPVPGSQYSIGLPTLAGSWKMTRQND